MAVDFEGQLPSIHGYGANTMERHGTDRGLGLGIIISPVTVRKRGSRAVPFKSGGLSGVGTRSPGVCVPPAVASGAAAESTVPLSNVAGQGERRDKLKPPIVGTRSLVRRTTPPHGNGSPHACAHRSPSNTPTLSSTGGSQAADLQGEGEEEKGRGGGATGAGEDEQEGKASEMPTRTQSASRKETDRHTQTERERERESARESTPSTTPKPSSNTTPKPSSSSASKTTQLSKPAKQPTCPKAQGGGIPADSSMHTPPGKGCVGKRERVDGGEGKRGEGGRGEGGGEARAVTISADEFVRKTIRRVWARARKNAAARREKRRLEMEATARGDGVDTDAFRRETVLRLKQRHLLDMTLAPGVRPARVAIVGAGPTGLWLATLLCRRYANFFVTAGGVTIERNMGAPRVDVFESRAPASQAGGGVRQYGTRKVVLAFASATQDLLNKNLLSVRALTSNHKFAPACSINLVETVLRDEFQKYVKAGFGQMFFGDKVEDPEELFSSGYDVVVVASGRHGLTEEWREERDLPVSVTGLEDALIFQFKGARGSERAAAAADASLTRTFKRCKHARGYIRPGEQASEGWVWVLGMAPEVMQLVRSRAQHDGGRAVWHSGFSAAVAVCEVDGKSLLAEAGAGLDSSLAPSEVSVQITAASYWASKDVVHLRRQAPLPCHHEAHLTCRHVTRHSDSPFNRSYHSSSSSSNNNNNTGDIKETETGSNEPPSPLPAGWVVLIGDAACGMFLLFLSTPLFLERQRWRARERESERARERESERARASERERERERSFIDNQEVERTYSQ